MSLQILIVDDEALARTRLRSLLAECTEPAAVVVAEAANAAEALELLQQISCDGALIDIGMPGADGIALVRAMRSLARPPAVVFVTAHAQYAVTAFEIDAVDYLTKPVRLERLQAALQKVERVALAAAASAPDAAQDSVLIQDRGSAHRVPLAQVVYFKAELKYVTLRTGSRSYILDGSLSELEERYPGRFLRVHRNALVARHAISALEKHYDPEEGEGWAVRLLGVDEAVTVSRRQLGAVREALIGRGSVPRV